MFNCDEKNEDDINSENDTESGALVEAEEELEESEEVNEDTPDNDLEFSKNEDIQEEDLDEDELSEEELDHIADICIEVLRKVLDSFDAQDAKINEYEGDERELILDIVGADASILIGHHGRNLEALQLLVGSIIRHRLGFFYPVNIDVEGYRNRQYQKLESLARNMASRAVRQGSAIKLRPMTPFERRLIHITLRDDTRVSTYSTGVDPTRCVTIKPI